MGLVTLLQLSQCVAAGLASPTSLAAAGRPNPPGGAARSGVPRLRAANLREAVESALRLKGGLAEDEGFDALGDGNVMVDVSGDGGVIKMVTRKGLGTETPVHGDEAFAHFNGTLSHINEREKEWNGTTVGGKLFDSSSLQVTDDKSHTHLPLSSPGAQVFPSSSIPDPPPSTPGAASLPSTRS